MKPVRLVSLLVAALLLAASAIAAACGGGGGGGASAEEYFADLQSLSDDINARFEAAFEEFGSALDPSASDEAVVEAAPKFAEEIASITSFAREGLEDLDPPSDVKEAHDEFTAAVAAFDDLAQGLVDDVGDVETAADVQTLFDAPEFEDSDARVTDACNALQEAASSKGIEVDLQCEE